ncbi:MAG TPA: DUF255 domain-containing protein [Saprospiraceae bacterium]|nr:DUF255 domain-containing protein [Saprospiraceae bacterium]
MSRFLLVLLLGCFSVPVVLAQGSKGRVGSTPTQTTLSPNPAASKSAKTSPGVSSNRNSTPSPTPNRPSTTLGNASSVKQPNPDVQERAVRPSSRPATYAPPTTAKGASGGQNTKAAPLKKAERGVVNWMSLEQALEKSKTEKRKIFVDMYTDWCGWCKHMDSTTFVDARVARYLNEHYYPVKFNAEQDKDIVFKDKTYKFKKSGARGYHELAILWLNNRLSFPTTVFLDENQQVIQPVPGYQDAGKMEAIINYFGSDSHKKTPWEAYEKTFNQAH